MASASPASASSPAPRWLPTGAEAYRRMLPALDQARISVRFEFYIYRADRAGDRFRTALTVAARRGVRVHLLLDAFGCAGLPADYWQELQHCGGEVRSFNPLTWRLFSLRNHRKLLLIDDAVAFIGGFNIADEYDGDGVTRGWRDLGLELQTPAALRQLAAAFDGMFAAAQLHHRMLQRLRRPWRRTHGAGRRGPVLLSGPRLGRNPFRSDLLRRLKRGKHVQIVSGYFLPGFRLRFALRQVVRRGGTVDLLLAGKSDVPLAQLAGRARYGSLLRAGVRIWEYQPQILHSKLAIIDDTVFVGSSNLDTRSFGINYELMVRFHDGELATSGRALFATDLPRSTEITLPAWQKSQGWLMRLRGLWAGFLLTKVDPWLAHAQLRTLS
jgi:cardiolipin synthase